MEERNVSECASGSEGSESRERRPDSKVRDDFVIITIRMYYWFEGLRVYRAKVKRHTPFCAVSLSKFLPLRTHLRPHRQRQTVNRAQLSKTYGHL